MGYARRPVGALHRHSGAILPGITRDSLLVLGRHMGFAMIERRIALDELLAQIGSGECTELFACGTAARCFARRPEVSGDRPVRLDARLRAPPVAWNGHNLAASADAFEPNAAAGGACRHAAAIND